MRTAALLLVPLFLFACDREPVAPDSQVLSEVGTAVTEIGQWVQNPDNRHWYALVDPMPWQDAEAWAVAQGGHLVTLRSWEEELWLKDTFGRDEHFYIGFNDIEEEGNWVWSSGEPVMYTNWAPGEPNDYLDEDAAVINWCEEGGVVNPECFGDFWNDLGIEGGRAIAELWKRPALGGALITNPGEGKPDAFCYFTDDDGYYTTTKVTTVRSPNANGSATLSCDFEGLPPILKARRLTGWTCTVNQGGISVTDNSLWVRTPSGHAQVTCQYDGTPGFDAAVVFDGEARPALEGAFTRPLNEFPDAQITGEVIDIGRACVGDPLLGDPTGKVALVVRGVCRFDEKIGNAVAAGAIAAIVYNNAANGDATLTMGGDPRPIPGVFVGHSTGLELRDAAPVTATLRLCRNTNTRANFNSCIP